MFKKISLTLWIFLCLLKPFYGQITATAQPFSSNANPSIYLAPGEYKYGMGVFLITASELAAFTSSSISSFGFSYAIGGSAATSGSLELYMQNTSDNMYSPAPFPNNTFSLNIANMVSVYNGYINVPGGPNAQTPFVLTMNLPTAFNYTGSGIYVAYSWTMTSVPNAVPQINNCVSTTTMAAYRTVNSPISYTSAINPSAYRPVCIIKGPNTATNEAGLVSVLAPFIVPEAMHADHVITADVKNLSINPLNNVSVALTVTGANTFTDTQIIPSIAAGAIETVSFAPFTPVTLGTNSILVSLPTDQNIANNQASRTESVSCNVAGNSPAVTYTQGYGDQTLGTICLSHFNFDAVNTLTAVRVGIGTDYSQGVSLYGVLMDDNQNIVATTNTIAMSQALFGTYQTFVFTTPQPISQGADYYIGMAETSGYCMGFIDAVVPAGIFFYSDLDGSNFTETEQGYFGIEPVIAGLDLSITQASTVICTGESIKLTGNGATSFTWSASVFDPIDNPNNQSVIVAPSGNETYTLYAQDDQGCSNTITTPVAVKICLGIASGSLLQTVEVYPNPAVNGKVFINGLQGATTVTVYNLLGEMVTSIKSDTEKAAIDLSGQPFGNYLVKITDANNNFKTVKIIHHN